MAQNNKEKRGLMEDLTKLLMEDQRDDYMTCYHCGGSNRVEVQNTINGAI